MSLSDLVDGISKLFSLIGTNTTSVVLSSVGLLLLLLATAAILRGLKSDPTEVPVWLKSALFISLTFGIAFSIGGPSITLLHISENALPRMSADQAFDNLQTNAFVGWLIRLIPFDPASKPYLGVGRLSKLGPDSQSFTFVAPYEELRGLSGKDAVRHVGGRFDDGNHLSAIIFRIPSAETTVLYPANARGMLQVIREIESDKNIDTDKALLKGTNELSKDEISDLDDSTEINSWRYDSFKNMYQHYCNLTYKFRCDRSKQQYSAKGHLGEINDDWHPLGFSQIKHSQPCSPQHSAAEFCTPLDWPAWKKSLLPIFGSRAFLLRNLNLDSLPGRYLIDLEDPAHQPIPDIGVR